MAPKEKKGIWEKEELRKNLPFSKEIIGEPERFGIKGFGNLTFPGNKN